MMEMSFLEDRVGLIQRSMIDLAVFRSHSIGCINQVLVVGKKYTPNQPNTFAFTFSFTFTMYLRSNL